MEIANQPNTAKNKAEALPTALTKAIKDGKYTILSAQDADKVIGGYTATAKKAGDKSPPPVFIYESSEPNLSLMSLTRTVNGKSEEFEVIAVTTAALKQFSQKELLASAAHELTHKKMGHRKQRDEELTGKFTAEQITARDLTRESQADRGAVEVLCEKDSMIQVLSKVIAASFATSGVVDFNDNLHKRVDLLKSMQVTPSSDGKSCRVK